MKTPPYTLYSTTTYTLGFLPSPVTVRGADYFKAKKTLQTLTWDLAGFVGIITIDVTIDDNSDTANYFTALTIGDGVTPLTEVVSQNIVGNFTWLKASVTQFGAGQINSVSVNY